MQKCLLVTTKDNRNFFTRTENFSTLIKFSQTFDAEIYIVEADHPNILSTEDLAGAICDSSWKATETKYNVLEKKLTDTDVTTNLSGRAKTLNIAFRIRSYIETEFLKGNIVSLHSVENKFKKHNLSTSAICNHISKVKQSLNKQNYEVKKLSAGKYQLVI